MIDLNDLGITQDYWFENGGFVFCWVTKDLKKLNRVAETFFRKHLFYFIIARKWKGIVGTSYIFRASPIAACIVPSLTIERERVPSRKQAQNYTLNIGLLSNKDELDWRTKTREWIIEELENSLTDTPKGTKFLHVTYLSTFIN